MSAGKRKLWHGKDDFVRLRNFKKIKRDGISRPSEYAKQQFINKSSFFSRSINDPKKEIVADFSCLSSDDSLNEDEQIDSADENIDDELVNSIVDVEDETDNIDRTEFSSGPIMQALNGQSTILALTNFSTPKKHCPSEQDLHIIDSGKKKKQRFVEDGLAKRLKALIEQKHRDKLFRNHKLKLVSGTGKMERNDHALTCELISCGFSSGHLTLFECTVKSAPQGFGVDGTNYVKILIPKQMVQDLQIGCACSVVVTHPWYILPFEDSAKVIFCQECSICCSSECKHQTQAILSCK